MSRYTLRYEFIDVPLAEGELVAGRAPDCDLVMDDAAVSRRHASFRVEDDKVMVQDLGSRNGVLVNGVSIEEPTLLRHADRVRVGTRELVLHDTQKTRRRRAQGTTELIRCPTCGSMKPPDVDCPHCGIGQPDSLVPPELPTVRMAPIGESDGRGGPDSHAPGGALNTLGQLADRALDMDRGAEAERILAGTLQRLLAKANEDGPAERVSEADAAKASHYAMRLAETTSNTSWANYPLELYMALDVVMPQAVIERFYGVVGPLRYKDATPLRSYIAQLRARDETLGANDRFILSRLDGLVRMISSR